MLEWVDSMLTLHGGNYGDQQVVDLICNRAFATCMTQARALKVAKVEGVSWRGIVDVIVGSPSQWHAENAPSK